ncbi:hypothetical protein CfE428DRAFT_1895 [Chthoniobacter flavus Ellin428]|uniref:Uncharacterized protein n=1 Tax=Chthoniobacter flavus Ellin428 TaxID=497964 RepID=B4CZ07_9BACT|nr:hypothetical protein CfE428DRAFT_1895 [Chthoniobacter flavus Ellin428]
MTQMDANEVGLIRVICVIRGLFFGAIWTVNAE